MWVVVAGTPNNVVVVGPFSDAITAEQWASTHRNTLPGNKWSVNPVVAPAA